MAVVRNSNRFMYRRALLAPLCLCLVAGVHLGRVAWWNQTAWKGGGFGMFSTVDAESARFIKLYLLTDQGEVPVELPDALRKRGAELRAAPSQQATADLAHRMLQLPWHNRQAEWSHLAAAIKANCNNVDFRLLHPTGEQLMKTHPAWLFGEKSPLEASRAAARERDTLIHAARVEVWRYRYDRTTRRLSAELWFQTTQHREGDAA